MASTTTPSWSEADSDASSESSEEDVDFLPSRMTPMEKDVHLQVAELVFRSLLEGKRLRLHSSDDVDDWHREALGEAWLQKNLIQRREVHKRMKAAGENTPMWAEAVQHMSDIGWEVFHTEDRREKLRRRKDIAATELKEELEELSIKLRESYYAQCGAGSNLGGFRACIAIFYIFMRDASVLGPCAECLRLAILDHSKNRNNLCELSLPVPPAARDDDFEDRGWSFLRRALDAFMVQSGLDSFSGSDPKDFEDEDDDDENSTGESPDIVVVSLDRKVAVQIAECIVAAREATALRAQLKLLREELPEDACAERRDLRAMAPMALRRTRELHAEQPDPALQGLIEILELSVDDPGMLEPPAPGPGGSGDDGDGDSPGGGNGSAGDGGAGGEGGDDADEAAGGDGDDAGHDRAPDPLDGPRSDHEDGDDPSAGRQQDAGLKPGVLNRMKGFFGRS